MVTALALSGWVYGSAPQRSVNRRLALVLLVEGITVGTVAGLTYLTDAPAQAAAWRLAATVPVTLILPAYLTFLATLDTPLVRPFRQRVVLVGLWIVAFAAIVLRPLAPGLFWIEFVPFGASSWNAAWTGPLATGFFGTIVLAYIYGLAAAFDAYRRAQPATPARDRARIYAVAFGVRDAVAVVVVGSWAIGGELASPEVEIALTNAAPLVMVLLLAYGLLRYQLLDIDLKVKWTIRQSTLVAFFLAAFFIVSELTAMWLSDQVGSVVGILVAGGLLFALAPLQRVAERVSDKAMPHVQDSEAYRGKRAREIYHAAVESALVDGTVTDRERDVLASLVEQLGLKPTEARAIERELAASARIP